VGDDLLGLEASQPQAGGQLEARIAQVIEDLIDPARCGPMTRPCYGWLAWAGVSARLASAARSRPCDAARVDRVLADAHAHDGPEAVASFAADLPEIGGAGSRWPVAIRQRRDTARHGDRSEPHGAGWLVHGTGPSVNRWILPSHGGLVTPPELASGQLHELGHGYRPGG
jgi:hypothetical protein